MYKALTIAGSDSSGGAGIQADLKTFTAHNIYGMSVITAITAQNTCGVFAVQDIEPDIVAAQLDAVFQDIFPDSLKIGMVSSCQIIEVITRKLKQYHPKNIVLDPVMISTSGHRLLKQDAQMALISKLLPLADLITPNIPEAEVLSGLSILNKELMVEAAHQIAKAYRGKILLKGGHLPECADDLLLIDGEVIWFRKERLDSHNSHGTGCTLSSAIASNLAAGLDIVTSVKNAKLYVYHALKKAPDLGRGNGPINHCFNLRAPQ